MQGLLYALSVRSLMHLRWLNCLFIIVLFFSIQNLCYPLGSEALPEGIIVKTSNFEMQRLWGSMPKNVCKSFLILIFGWLWFLANIYV